MKKDIREFLFVNAEDVKRFNKIICEDSANESHCFDLGKVESALHSAFCPGSPPFQHGGIIEIGAAIAFYKPFERKREKKETWSFRSR